MGGRRLSLLSFLGALAGCGPAPAPPAPPSPTASAPLAAPDLCALLPAYHPACVRGIQASGDATCVHSDSKVACFGPDIDPAGEVVDMALPPGAIIDRLAFDQSVFCALRAGRPQCLFRKSGRWESPPGLPGHDLVLSGGEVCLHVEKSHICYATSASGFTGAVSLDHRPAVPCTEQPSWGNAQGARCAAPDLNGVVHGPRHACGLRQGVASCWGANEHGQTGAPPGWPDPASSHQLTALVGPRMLAAGRSHTCALLAGGEIVCWGRALPGLYPGARPRVEPRFTALGGSGREHLALREDGKLFSITELGGSAEVPLPSPVRGLRGRYAQLVDGRLLDVAGAPRAIGLSGPMVDFMPSLDCARLTGGEVECWGENDSGKLAPGQPAFSAEQQLRGAATPVRRPTHLFDVVNAPGAEARCALDPAGALTCWGAIAYHWEYFNGPYKWVGNHLPSWNWHIDRDAPTRLAPASRFVDATPSGCLLDDRGRLHRLDFTCRRGRCELHLFSAPSDQKVTALLPGYTCRGTLASGDTAELLDVEIPVKERFGPQGPPPVTIAWSSLHYPAPPPPTEPESHAFGVTCRAPPTGGLRCRSKADFRHLDGEMEPLFSHEPRQLFAAP